MVTASTGRKNRTRNALSPWWTNSLKKFARSRSAALSKTSANSAVTSPPHRPDQPRRNHQSRRPQTKTTSGRRTARDHQICAGRRRTSQDVRQSPRSIYADLLNENERVKRSVELALREEQPERGGKEEMLADEFSSYLQRKAKKNSIFINLSEGEKTIIEGESYLDQVINDNDDFWSIVNIVRVLGLMKWTIKS